MCRWIYSQAQRTWYVAPVYTRRTGLPTHALVARVQVIDLFGYPHQVDDDLTWAHLLRYRGKLRPLVADDDHLAFGQDFLYRVAHQGGDVGDLALNVGAVSAMAARQA